MSPFLIFILTPQGCKYIIILIVFRGKLKASTELIVKRIGSKAHITAPREEGYLTEIYFTIDAIEVGPGKGKICRKYLGIFKHFFQLIGFIIISRCGRFSDNNILFVPVDVIYDVTVIRSVSAINANDIRGLAVKAEYLIIAERAVDIFFILWYY